MKKIMSRSDSERRRIRNQRIVGIVIIIIMVFGTVAYALSSTTTSTSKKKYNGFDFIKYDSVWVTEVEAANIKLNLQSIYFPEELEYITENNKPLIYDYYQQPVYVVFSDDEYEKQSFSWLYPVIKDFVLRIQEGCLENKECNDSELPVINCNDDNKKIIIFENKASDLNINVDGNCLFITAENEDLIKSTQKVIFEMFSVM